jgi:hypothetical protein
MRRFFPLLLLFVSCATPDPGPRVILITLDGLRWEEVFTGADPWLLENPAFTSDMDNVRARFWRDAPEARREALMPFFWSTIASEGSLWGNQHLGSVVKVSNNRVFSYPGYNEILTGFADEAIDSNNKIPNANETLLEWVNKQPGFEGEVAAFGSWDVFPYIINEERSGVPVNAGFESATGELTDREAWLNEVQEQTPSPWTSVRLDVFTHHYAFETLKQDRPRLLYIAYGETDDFAHDADYRHYLDAAYRTDAFIRDLWTWVQADKEYAGRTTLVITTDHGRGSEDRFVGHGVDWIGSEFIWIASLGPGMPVLGEFGASRGDGSDISVIYQESGVGAEGAAVQDTLWQNQVAATVADLLGLEYTNRVPVGRSLRR